MHGTMFKIRLLAACIACAIGSIMWADVREAVPSTDPLPQVTEKKDVKHDHDRSPANSEALFCISMPTTQAVTARTSRVMPTHNGNGGRNLISFAGKWIDFLSHQSSYFYRQNHQQLWQGMPSPRLYYVITLERLLC